MQPLTNEIQATKIRVNKIQIGTMDGLYLVDENYSLPWVQGPFPSHSMARPIRDGVAA